jgi:hypothetical protein
MYALLLIFGAVIAAAGIALVGSGVSVQEHTFDPTVVTPGVVAIVGGLILIGLGLAVRQLARIEKVLAVRPIARTALPEQAVVSVTATEQASAPAIPFPPKPATEPAAPPQLPEITPAPVTAAAQEAERLREKFPSLLRLENPPVVEETDVSLLPKPPARADEEIAETGNVVAARQANGTTPSRTLPRLEVSARATGRPDRAKNFDAFWPKRKRPGSGVHAVAAQPAMPAEPVLPIPQSSHSEPAPVAESATAPEAPTPISILKSGVVDGMAYTLYSDGSIEAQLPQGMLRFGSITELRNHIEQSA